ncbi:GerAB/ArcD/ProY family transporter [Cohnella zeiphila]|uniref:GerAB/ArcD/ProY family transporter n=1 Tax=Cohnella zeiphila TaxID=2761120 RepID=A0A7X0SQ10_9BACL|nr:GerAB/ArcD/ProY family transporter [Cohnella zeiphila]MBB6731763.1 GerAB/ArcD/ProY family transporter [Cohnella zeiphila]
MQVTSRYQLAAAVFLFQLGSSPMFLLAGPAGRDAWIGVLIGFAAGLLLLVAVMLPIHRIEPEMNLIEVSRRYFGPWFGSLLSFSYVLYFIYQAVRNFREFSDWVILYLLPSTPLLFILAVLMFISSYAVWHGVEVFFRLTELLCPWIVLMYAALFASILASHLIHPELLEPVLEHGIRPVVAAALPEVISFPFGEMVLFLMFWKFAGASHRVSRATLLAYLSAATLLFAANVLIVSVLGPFADVSVIPLMQITSMVQIGEAIERLDPVVLLLLFVGVFIKQTAYFMAAVLSLSELLRIRFRFAIGPVGVMIYLGALAFRSYMQQVRIGFKLNVVYHFPIFQIALPILILAVMLIRSPGTPKIRRADDGGIR